MYSQDFRAKIKEAYERLKNFRLVGRKFDVSHQTVKYIVENDPAREKKKRGPKFSLTRGQELAIKREVRKANSEGARVTARTVKENCAISNLSLVSVRRNLKRLGFKQQVHNQEIVLTRAHKQKKIGIRLRN